MGYWARNGAYVYDENDIKAREDMNETQGQAFERHQRGIAAMQRYQEEERKKQEAEREFRAKMRQDEWEAEQKAAEARRKQWEKEQTEQKEAENRKRYGVPYDLRNPQTLSDRRARANFWRIHSPFQTFINYYTGKSEKFHNLWNQYAIATTDEERLQIVEQMEKMFPTREGQIRRVERKTGYRR